MEETTMIDSILMDNRRGHTYEREYSSDEKVEMIQIYNVAKHFFYGKKYFDDDGFETIFSSINDRSMLLSALSNQYHAVILTALSSFLKENDKSNNNNNNNNIFTNALKLLCCRLIEEANFEQIRIHLDERVGKVMLDMIQYCWDGKNNNRILVEEALLEYLYKCLINEGYGTYSNRRNYSSNYTEAFRKYYAVQVTLRVMENQPNNRDIQLIGMKLLRKVACIFFETTETTTTSLLVDDEQGEGQENNNNSNSNNTNVSAMDRVLVAMNNFENDVEIQLYGIINIQHSYILYSDHTESKLPVLMMNYYYDNNIAKRLFNVLRLHHMNESVRHGAIDALFLVFKHKNGKYINIQELILWVPTIINIMVNNKEFTAIYFILSCLLQKDGNSILQAIINYANGLHTIFDGLHEALVEESYGLKHIRQVVNILIGTCYDSVLNTISQTDGLLSDILVANLQYKYEGMENGWDPVILNLARVKSNTDGRLPLHYLVSLTRDRYVWSCNLLTMVECFANVYPEGCRTYDNNGNFPLHLAIKTNNNNTSIDIIKVLINADQSTKTFLDGDGNLPIELPCSWNIFIYIFEVTPPSVRNGEITIGKFPPPIMAAINNCNLSNIYILLRQNVSFIV